MKPLFYALGFTSLNAFEYVGNFLRLILPLSYISYARYTQQAIKE